MDTHTQLILPIHWCVTVSHFASEETQAQNDLFDLQQTYQEIRKESKNRSSSKVQPKVEAWFPKVVVEGHPFVTKSRVFISKQF